MTFWKILILLGLICFMGKDCFHGSYVHYIIGSLTCVWIVVDLYCSWIESLSEYYKTPQSQVFKSDAWGNYWDKNTTTTYNKHQYLPNGEKEVAKEIYKTMALRKNIHSTTVVKEAPKTTTSVIVNTQEPITIDNTKKNRPVVDMSAKQVTSVLEPRYSSKTDFLWLENEPKISKEREICYNAIAKAINADPNLNPNDRYTLLQSVLYVEFHHEYVLILIHQPILAAKKMTDARLNKDLIVANIKEAFNNQNIKVEFDNVLLPTLLDYYLGVRTSN